MPAVSQPSFTTGELAPSLYGRVDLARFYTALKTCRNFIVRPYGGVMNRPGTRFITEVKDSTVRVRLLEFVFSTSQTYVLEFGEEYIRFITNGGYVLDDEDLPIEVVTPYQEADLPFLSITQSADVLTICHTSYKQRQLSRLSHTSWTLAEYANVEGPFLDTNVVEANTIIASAPTGSVDLTSSFDVFTEDKIGLMLYLEQSPDDGVSRWEVQKAIILNDIRRRGAGYYQAATQGTTGTVPPSVIEGAEVDGDPGVKWNYLHSGFGVVRITDVTDARHATATVIRRIPDQVTQLGVLRDVTNVVTGTPAVPPAGEDPGIPMVPASVQVGGHGFANGSIVNLAEITGAEEANGQWTIEVIDGNWFYLLGLVLTSAYTGGGTASLSTEAVATYKWAWEAWGSDQYYPAATIYHNQRQIFGGSIGRPQTVWESKSGGGFLDFGTSNPILDDDAIKIDLNSLRMNEIRHFVEIGDLIALTSEGAWLIKKEQGDPVPSAKFQGRGGASRVPPVVVGENALFVMEKGGAIRSLAYFFDSDKYRGRDLTMTGSHLLFGKEVKEWAYQETPFNTVWIVLDDGGLLGLTYLPDQEVIGWHRHDTDGLYESVCCVSEGREDAVYVVVKRTIGGVEKRYIERFTSRFFTDIEDAFFVDCGLTYDGRLAGSGKIFTLSGGVEWDYQETLTFTTTTNFFTGISDVGDAIVLYDADGEALRLTILEYVSAKIVQVIADRTVPAEFRNVATTGFQVARDTFSGLGHLEGETVSILADGNVEAQKVVTGGVIALENPSVVVHAGLPIEADFETLDVNVQGQSIQDKLKNVRSVTLVVEKTRGLFAGPDADHLLEVLPEMTGGYDTPIMEKTGVMKINIVSDWSEGGRVFIRQSDPLPATILAAIPEVVISG
jgi:hypothetical protein